MTRQEYTDYQKAVASFFSNGLANLSTISDEEGLCEPFFSWHSCQCCGTHLGGNRYQCNGYNEQTKEVETYDCICEDCMYYAEYGRLDDTTMMEIEQL